MVLVFFEDTPVPGRTDNIARNTEDIERDDG